jgi:hypothetical protein
VSWGAQAIDYFGLISALEIAGCMGLIYPFCHLGDEGCKPVK